MANDNTRKHLKGIKAFISIDIGYTYSGYSYAIYKPDGLQADDIHSYKWHSEKAGFKSYKTSTALLYSTKEDKQFLEFGFNAVENFKSDDSRTTETELCEFFKKSEKQAQRRDLFHMTCTDTGSDRPTLGLYSKIIQKLSEHCLKTMEDECGSLNNTEVLWIFCYPVVWPFHEKESLRAAAYQAGLLTELTSTNIMIISEADASYEYARSLSKARHFKPTTKLERDKDVAKLLSSSGILVADCGGSTVDVTMQYTTDNGKSFRQHVSTHGIEEGGEKVNRAFEKVLVDILGLKFIEHCKKTSPSFWRKFMGVFDFAKRKVHGTQKSISIAIPHAMHKKYNEFFKQPNKLHTMLNNTRYENIEFDSEHDTLILSEPKVREMFDTTVKPIIEHIKTKAKDSKSEQISLVILTGGFSECDYLEKSLQAELKEIPVLIPDEPNIAVLKGSILYCFSQYLIDTWKSDATYHVQLKDHTNKRLIISTGQTLLQGNLYEQTIPNEYHSEVGTISILRNDETFITEDFKDNGKGDTEYKVLLQYKRGMVIISISDQTLGVTLINGKLVKDTNAEEKKRAANLSQNNNTTDNVSKEKKTTEKLSHKKKNTDNKCDIT